VRIALNHLEGCCSAITAYLATDIHHVPAHKAQRRLSDLQYEELVELLVFHCLVPLKAYDDAISFLNNNRSLSTFKREVCMRCVLSVLTACSKINCVLYFHVQ